MRAIIVLASLAIAGAAHAQAVNDMPAPGQIGPLGRWIVANKIDDSTAAALLICESNVTAPASPGASVNFNPDFLTSCTALRKKVVDATSSSSASKKAADKAAVDAVAK